MSSVLVETSSSTSSTPTQKPVSVLFVCLGNICRSPMAEGVFKSLIHPSHSLIADVDSAGTAAYHTGSSPDSRTMKTLLANGITTYQHVARRVTTVDFERFDWIFAMDQENLEDLVDMRSRLVKKRQKNQIGNATAKDIEDGLGKVMLWGTAGGFTGEQVDDPYYGVDNGFDVCFEQMIRFSKGFLKSLEESAIKNSGKVR